MNVNKAVFGGCVALVVPIADAFAATSEMNNNVRVFEDTLWLFTFGFMVVLGLLMSRLSGGMAQKGFHVFVAAGSCGLLWKSIGLVKRITGTESPEWLYQIARETFEGLVGVLLAIAFALLITSLVRTFRVN